MFKKLFGIDKLEDKISSLESNVSVKEGMIKELKGENDTESKIFKKQEEEIKTLEGKIKSLSTNLEAHIGINKESGKVVAALEKTLSTANFSIKPAIARNIKASEDEKSYYSGFLGKDKMESFATFYKDNRAELEDITNQILRNFLKGGGRDSATYSAAQEIAESYMSFFAGSYGETQTPEGQDEGDSTNE